MPETVITQDQIVEYLKLLVELGGVFTVDDSFTIRSSKTNEPLKTSKQGKHIRLYNTHMVAGSDWTYLNPLVDTLGQSEERIIFWDMLNTILAYLLKTTFRSVVEYRLNIKENTPDQNDDALLDPKYLTMTEYGTFAADIDSQTITNVDKIPIASWLTVFYERKKRTAQLQSAIITQTDDIAKTTGVRKKDVQAVKEFICKVLQTENPSEIQYTATILGILEADARLHVITMVIELIQGVIKAILDIDLHGPELTSHLELLNHYHKLVSWHVSSTIKQKGTKLPWAMGNDTAQPTNPQESHVVSAAQVALSTPTMPNVIPINPNAPTVTPMPVVSAPGVIQQPTVEQPPMENVRQMLLQSSTMPQMFNSVGTGTNMMNALTGAIQQPTSGVMNTSPTTVPYI